MYTIGIAGGTGCGKTTVVNTIVNQLNNEDLVVISQDSYYRDTSHLSFDERVEINFDHPRSIDFELLTKHVKALKKHQSIEQPVYSFKEHNRTGETKRLDPKKVLIVEGILIFNYPELRDLFDLKLFVEADSDERLIRRLKRDIGERGRDMNEVLDRYQKTLKPMHLQFIEPTKMFADLIIPYNSHNTAAIEAVKTIINNEV
jgi:uridine kinase